jgi:nitric oxide reductase large subunit
MNWWIGFCWIGGSICFAVLDHRARKLAGKRWLSEWPWRLVTYFALGSVFAAIGYAPFFLYQLGEAIVDVYNHPPTSKMLAVLLVFAVAILAVEILKLARRTIREISSSQHGIQSMAAVRRVAGALVLFAVAVGVLGAGLLFGLYVLRSL